MEETPYNEPVDTKQLIELLHEKTLEFSEFLAFLFENEIQKYREGTCKNITSDSPMPAFLFELLDVYDYCRLARYQDTPGINPLLNPYADNDKMADALSERLRNPLPTPSNRMNQLFEKAVSIIDDIDDLNYKMIAINFLSRVFGKKMEDLYVAKCGYMERGRTGKHIVYPPYNLYIHQMVLSAFSTGLTRTLLKKRMSA